MRKGWCEPSLFCKNEVRRITLFFLRSFIVLSINSLFFMRNHLILLFISLAMIGYGQTTDTELWAGGKIKMNVTKRIRVSANIQNRWDQNISRSKYHLYQFGVRYKINKSFSLEPSYRFTRYSNDINLDKNRASMNINYSFNKKGFPLTIENRLRYQFEFLANQVKREHMIRNRIELGYKLSKLVDPYLSYEYFFPFGGKPQHRIRAKLDWRVTKEFHVGTFYAFEQELARKKKDITHIMGVMLNYSFDLKKK